MKLTILIPVTGSISELDKIEEAILRQHLMADTEIETLYIEKGFPAIESETHAVFNAPSVVLAAKAACERGSDGVFVNCFDEPGVLACRELLPIPVLGGCQPALHMARLSAERFAVITIDQANIASVERAARLHGISPAVIRVVDMGVLALRDDMEELVRRLTTACLDLGTAERCGAVVLGCTGMCAAAAQLQRNLRKAGSSLTVVEPYVTGVVQLETLVRLGCSNHIPDLSPAMEDLRWD